MTETLFELPVTSSHFMRGTELRKLSGHRWGLFWTVESEDGGEHEQSLVFDGVQSFRCTYKGAISAKSIELAYDTLVELSGSEELKSLQATIEVNRRELPKQLKHMVIYFDGGPYYEFFATTFTPKM